MTYEHLAAMAAGSAMPARHIVDVMHSTVPVEHLQPLQNRIRQLTCTTLLQEARDQYPTHLPVRLLCAKARLRWASLRVAAAKTLGSSTIATAKLAVSCRACAARVNGLTRACRIEQEIRRRQHRRTELSRAVHMLYGSQGRAWPRG